MIKLIDSLYFKLVFIILVFTSCNKDISRGYYATETFNKILIFENDSVFFYEKLYMASGYNSYSGIKVKRINKIKSNLFRDGYDRVKDSLRYKDSVSSRKLDITNTDSFQYLITFYLKDEEWPIEHLKVNLYKNNKLFKEYLTEIDGTISFSTPKNDLSVFKIIPLKYKKSNLSLYLDEYRNQHTHIYIAQSKYAKLYYGKIYLELKIRTGEAGKTIVVNGIKYKRQSLNNLEKSIQRRIRNIMF